MLIFSIVNNPSTRINQPQPHLYSSRLIYKNPLMIVTFSTFRISTLATNEPKNKLNENM